MLYDLSIRFSLTPLQFKLVRRGCFVITIGEAKVFIIREVQVTQIKLLKRARLDFLRRCGTREMFGRAWKSIERSRRRKAELCWKAESFSHVFHVATWRPGASDPRKTFEALPWLEFKRNTSRRGGRERGNERRDEARIWSIGARSARSLVRARIYAALSRELSVIGVFLLSRSSGFASTDLSS